MKVAHMLTGHISSSTKLQFVLQNNRAGHTSDFYVFFYISCFLNLLMFIFKHIFINLYNIRLDSLLPNNLLKINYSYKIMNFYTVSLQNNKDRHVLRILILSL